VWHSWATVPGACPLAGQGASLALAGGFHLAEAVAHYGVSPGLARWEDSFRPVVEDRQAAGRRTADWFVPEGDT
jgi:2-polyprenyl-6-methoxyphenol hydroxylase-like FAD-dependent oxidoreductase